MRVVIFYAGGAERVAGLLSSEFALRNIDVNLVKAEETTQSDAAELIARADVCLFGFSLVSGRICPEFRKFAGMLPALESKKPTGIFCVQKRISFNGAQLCASALKPLGFKTVWAWHFLSPDNDKKLLKCEMDAATLAAFINKDRPLRQGFSIWARAAGFIYRLFCIREK